MGLKLEDKKAIVEKLGHIAKNASSVITAEYRNLTAREMDQLRSQARDLGVFLCVARNTLARRALKGTPFACLQETLVGPLILAFSQKEPNAVARLIRDFCKKNEKLIVKALVFDGQLWPTHELAKIADLPTRDEAVARLMCVIKAPISRLARTLAEPYAKLARTLSALLAQRQMSAK